MNNIKEILILVNGKNIVDIEYREIEGGEGFTKQEYIKGSKTDRFLELLEHHLINAYETSVIDFNNRNCRRYRRGKKWKR